MASLQLVLFKVVRVAVPGAAHGQQAVCVGKRASLAAIVREVRKGWTSKQKKEVLVRETTELGVAKDGAQLVRIVTSWRDELTVDDQGAVGVFQRHEGEEGGLLPPFPESVLEGNLGQ